MFTKKSSSTEKINELEKRVEEMELQMEEEIKELRARTREQIRDIGESFKMLKNVMKRLQDEKDGLEKDRDFLIERHKELIQRIPVDRSRLKRDIREKLLMPLHKKVRENADLIKEAALEGMCDGDAAQKKNENIIESIKSAVAGDETRTPIDELFELVMRQGTVKLPDAARQFTVSESQLEEWAKILESHGLIEMHYPPIGRPELRKKQE